jgi:hypothetical protein
MRPWSLSLRIRRPQYWINRRVASGTLTVTLADLHLLNLPA